jgi:predicted RNase H-like HicB family nuclease
MKWMHFKIKLEKDEDGIYVATVPALPGCISQGKTENEAIENIKAAIQVHLEYLAEDGIPITKSKDMKEIIIDISI